LAFYYLFLCLRVTGKKIKKIYITTYAGSATSLPEKEMRQVALHHAIIFTQTINGYERHACFVERRAFWGGN
jgi:hypothetical protein